MQALNKALFEFYRAQDLKRSVGLPRNNGYKHEIDRYRLSRNPLRHNYVVHLFSGDMEILIYRSTGETTGDIVYPGKWQQSIVETIWKQTGRDLLAYRDACEVAQGALDDLIDLTKFNP